MQRVAVLLDGGESAEVGVTVALPLVNFAGSELLLIRTTYDSLESTVPVGAQHWRRKERQARHYLEQMRGRVQAVQGVVVECLVSSDPLLETLKPLEDDLDLVILVSSGRSGFARWAYGSESERLMAGLGCSVLVLPAED